MCNAGSRGEANSACGKIIWLWACILRLRIFAAARCSGLPAPLGAKFAAVASRGPLECATDQAVRTEWEVRRAQSRGVREGTCPRAYHRPPGGRVRAFRSIRTI